MTNPSDPLNSPNPLFPVLPSDADVARYVKGIDESISAIKNAISTKATGQEAINTLFKNLSYVGSAIVNDVISSAVKDLADVKATLDAGKEYVTSIIPKPQETASHSVLDNHLKSLGI